MHYLPVNLTMTPGHVKSKSLSVSVCCCLFCRLDSAILPVARHRKRIVGQSVSLADRNYYNLQKLFDKNHALFLRIEIIWQSLRTFVSRMFPVCLNSVQGVFPKDFKGVLNLIFS